jgi:hypothetical protein
MCEECNPIESNTGVIHYSGPDLVICNGNTITNGELLTSVIAKIDNCIGALQFELDFTGLVENSPCINLTKTSLQTVLQSILNTESAYCTQLQTLNTQITNLQTQVNNLLLAKPVVVTACDPSRVQLTQGNVVNTFKINGLVPPKTILPYFGLPTDFSPTGLGIAGTQTAGWAIANGQNGTIKVIDTANLIFPFIKYGPSAITASSGSNSVTLDATNIPSISFTTNANFNLSGTTDEAGLHRHILSTAGTDGCDGGGCGEACGDCPDGIPVGYEDRCGAAGTELEGFEGGCGSTSKLIGPSGLHSHTFNATATGSFTGNSINNDVQAISVVPVHIQAIPIQWVGCS